MVIHRRSKGDVRDYNFHGILYKVLKRMEAKINLLSNVNEEDSYALLELATLLENECDVVVQQKRDSVKSGVKDGGLVIALTVAGLALSAISTLFAALSYWQTQQQSKQVKYSVAVIIGNKIFQVENLTFEQAQSEIGKLQVSEQVIDIQVTRH
jgi:hypothetical protein